MLCKPTKQLQHAVCDNYVYAPVEKAVDEERRAEYDLSRFPPNR